METLKEKTYNLYQTRIKKHKDCPVCKGMDSMIAHNESKIWECESCGYSITY